MTDERAPEVPVRFYRSATGREPVTGLASQSRQPGQASDRIRSDARAVWLANRHAPCAKLERRPFGGTISSAKPANVLREVQTNKSIAVPKNMVELAPSS